ncbi:hypothetical protein AB2L28_01925 [Kineococcus sp. TBRC 1896]|uniref:Uncharacterized protein n=1 Tax=Kineococcus mangrovi TaxID=1660183 RepID=A0ABV4I196_9ACTN
MRVTRAVALLPVLPGDLPHLEDSLEHLIEAADEASAAGIATTLLVTTSAPATATAPVLASWEPLVDLLDDVDLEVEHHPGAGGDPATEVARLLTLAAAGLHRRLEETARTVVLTSTPDVAVGPDWITEHVRHHRAGATASTGPVRRAGGPGQDHRHDTVANLAVRADLLPGGVLAALSAAPGGDGRVALVHALTPVVASPSVTIPSSP